MHMYMYVYMFALFMQYLYIIYAHTKVHFLIYFSRCNAGIYHKYDIYASPHIYVKYDIFAQKTGKQKQ